MRTAKVSAACAPWVRTRLRTAPGITAALAVLVLVTAFLAAAFPRAVDAYGTEALRREVGTAPPGQSVLEVTSPPPPLGEPLPAREQALREEPLSGIHRSLLASLPEPVRADAEDSSYGVHTTKGMVATEPWLPRPNAAPPQFRYAAPSALDEHSTLTAGRWPAVRGEVTAKTGEVEAAVTVETAAELGMEPGSTIAVPTQGGQPLTVRVTGVVEPLRPGSGYWAVDPLYRAPSLVQDPGSPTPVYYWTAALLLAPDAGPVLLDTTGEPELYWRLAPDASGLTATDVPRLRSALASLENGPGLLELRSLIGPNTALLTNLDALVDSYTATREAIDPVVTVAAVGVGTVAAVVLLMTGGLIGGRRHGELALLRSRGASLAGIGGRLLAETAVAVVPAAALGLGLAVALIGEARWWPSVVGAGSVAVLVCAALPARTALEHRRPLLHGAREDVVAARPSRRRTVAELTLLVLAVGAVAALRRRGTGSDGDLLVSAAPVLVGLIAALVLVRLYPLPLRLAARPVARLRGAVGFLSLARAGRASASGTLPLLALLIALTTASFGGSVLAGISDARDEAALRAVGADARISGESRPEALTDGLVADVRAVRGADGVVPVRIEYANPLSPASKARSDTPRVTLLGVEPDAYARLDRAAGLPSFSAGVLAAGGEGDALPVIVSPSVAGKLGDGPHTVRSSGGDITVRVAGVLPRTSAVDSDTFMIVDRSSLEVSGPTTLLVTGGRLDGKALRAVAHDADASLGVRLRAEEREALSDTPLQTGAERVYGAAVGAGAGYALLAVLLSLLRTAPERRTLLARLRTMGLTTAQGRRLLASEAMPQALLAAVGGLLVGWTAVVLLAPGIDLAALALADAGPAAASTASLRADPVSLVLPAVGVVLLTAGVAGVQAWWASRRGSIKELRAGDTR
ncbi:ABC transporter permease [Streptomyces nitrosporeus]|uniref:ABC transporter permease n=1 Tax=Streptomyces nitrosporeus TaxID=28894 RepID=A0A5J6FEH8_9ACTN|nr:FtsX-like permease family protein [Streptomyces nitrosporeus]QEU74451.1 ABC transporter permease [Streptomyces nitrosporeus]GGY83152.1 membrane protein [Streptomyces nitrosporeus]